jgi:hypothetical protein
MDMQGWFDELCAQLADNPNRESVIECLEHLLDGIKDGEDFPTLSEGDNPA